MTTDSFVCVCVCYKRKKKKQGMKSIEPIVHFVVVLGPETSAIFLFRGTFIYAATALGAMRLPIATAYGVAIPIALLTMG